jgi:hypothetical protein
MKILHGREELIKRKHLGEGGTQVFAAVYYMKFNKYASIL